MKDKNNPACEGLKAAKANPRNPRKAKAPATLATAARLDAAEMIDWRDVRGFDPRRPRYGDEVPASVEYRMDPAGLARAKASRERMEAAERDRREMLDATAELLKGGALVYLRSRGTLTDRMFRAGLAFQGLHRSWTGGMPAADFMREKVDGGRVFMGPSGIIGNALDAERRCREMLRLSNMGLEAAEVVLRVCGYEEALKVIACDFEDSPAAVARAKAALKPSREAQAHVRRLLRSGLAALADHLYGRERRETRRFGAMLAEWLTLDLVR